MTVAQERDGVCTLEDIEALDKTMLTAADIAGYIGTNPLHIRAQAHADPDKLGFPVIVHGSQVRIPKAGFVFYCRYGRPSVDTARVMGE